MTTTRIGPGTLVLIVGPSGAGKDTLISLASDACRNNPAIVFPRRIVTRPSSDAEDHDSLTTAGFDEALARGHFAFWWDAHGHRYGVPKAIEAEIEAGRLVVCNVSRAIIPDLRKRYEHVATVLVTADPQILAGRLTNRRRGSDGAIEQRIERNSIYSQLETDFLIENDHAAEAAGATLSMLLRYLSRSRSGKF